MNHLEHLISNKNIFFNFMKEDYPLFQYSNLFFRDLQYAISAYFELKENPVNYSKSAKIADSFVEYLCKQNELQSIDKKTWRVNFEVGNKPKELESEGVLNEQSNN